MFPKLSCVVHIGKFNQSQLVKHPYNGVRSVHSVRIEANPLAPNRKGKKKPAPGAHDPLQFESGFDTTLRIDRIAIAPETDMLDDM